jgi:ferric-dicitrate binding protein FerR (iron transport regulator)
VSETADAGVAQEHVLAAPASLHRGAAPGSAGRVVRLDREPRRPRRRRWILLAAALVAAACIVVALLAWPGLDPGIATSRAPGGAS